MPPCKIRTPVNPVLVPLRKRVPSPFLIKEAVLSSEEMSPFKVRLYVLVLTVAGVADATEKVAEESQVLPIVRMPPPLAPPEKM